MALQTNLKVGAVRNLAAQEASGQVLFFCDSDDLFKEVRQAPISSCMNEAIQCTPDFTHAHTHVCVVL